MRTLADARGRAALSFCLILGLSGPALAADPALPAPEETPSSPALRLERGGRRPGDPPAPAAEAGFRAIDGRENNAGDPEMGAAGARLLRRAPAEYADGVSALAGADRPSARAVSNAVSAQPGPLPNPYGASDYLWQWGQFLDHDIDLTGGAEPAEAADIPIPAGDPFFDPEGTGAETMPFGRSLYDEASGAGPGDPRQQVNEITAWIDASQVYGSDAERASALRTNDGTGRLRVSEGDLLPFNTEGLPNAGGPSGALFLAGDVRANEQAGLAAMHTLFVREHNRLAGEIAAREPGLGDEEIYQRARRRVGAEMQAITYREFLPALLGPDALAPYRGYEPGVNAGIRNEFSTAAYRFGHSALSATILRLDARGDESPFGHLALRDAFFAPSRITDEGGIEPILRGLARQACQAIDAYVVDDVRNFLFGAPGQGGFDLASLNIQRGRDHGLASYNRVRGAYGLSPARRFADITTDPDLQARLASVYDSPEDVDLWVGGLAEDPAPGAHVGPLVRRILKEQFEALRDGDRFFYRNALPPEEIAEVEATRLADVIRRNTKIGAEIADDVFHVAPAGSGPGDPPLQCGALPPDSLGLLGALAALGGVLRAARRRA